MPNVRRAKFPVGRRLLATPAALEELQKAGQTVHELLARHIQGDWGDVCEEDAAANEAAIGDGSRILSAYVLNTGTRVWMITEAADEHGQRAATTALLPTEY